MRRLIAFVFTYRGAMVPLTLIPGAVLPVHARHTGYDLLCLMMVMTGMIFRILGVRGIGGRARVHRAEVRTLVTSGIYGHVRNPLYIGNALVAGGVSALFLSYWSAPLTVLSMLCLYTAVVRYEEQCLERQLGPPYRRYLDKVPRWRLRLKPYRSPDGVEPPRVSWKEVIRAERFFLLGMAGACLVGLIHVIVIGLPAAGILAAVFLLLFARIAARLHRKRGSWLAVDRLPPPGFDVSSIPEGSDARPDRVRLKSEKRAS